MRRKGRSADGGFTLIELLVCIAILGLIAVPLTDVVITFLKDSSTTGGRLTESHDEQIVSAFWQQDVSSIGVRSTTFTNNAFALQQSVVVGTASTACTLPAGTQVVTLEWNQYNSSGTPTLVTTTYLRSGSAAPYKLIRAQCIGSTLHTSGTIADDLTGTPSVACANSAGTSLTCSSSSPVPSTISLGLSVASPTGHGQPYSVTLTGQRRQT